MLSVTRGMSIVALLFGGVSCTADRSSSSKASPATASVPAPQPSILARPYAAIASAPALAPSLTPDPSGRAAATSVALSTTHPTPGQGTSCFPHELSERVETIKVTHMGASCSCAQWRDARDERYDDAGRRDTYACTDPATCGSIYIARALDARIDGDAGLLAYSGMELRPVGRFYTDRMKPGCPDGHKGDTEIARVFRYEELTVLSQGLRAGYE